jgi:hypothetical protein
METQYQRSSAARDMSINLRTAAFSSSGETSGVEVDGDDIVLNLGDEDDIFFVRNFVLLFL